MREAARIELGLRAFLEDGGFKGFTTTFEDLRGLAQLPGLAVQRLMADGYGFGAEGDWKTAALVRAMKVMAAGLQGGTSFMEDYTYHLGPSGMKVLGAHMLEVCASIADEKPSLEMHPLGIGGKADPARLVFNMPAGPGAQCLALSTWETASAWWSTRWMWSRPTSPAQAAGGAGGVGSPAGPQTAAAAWIFAGGAHHTGFSQAVTAGACSKILPTIAGIELLFIGAEHHVCRVPARNFAGTRSITRCIAGSPAEGNYELRVPSCE